MPREVLRVIIGKILLLQRASAGLVWFAKNCDRHQDTRIHSTSADITYAPKFLKTI